MNRRFPDQAHPRITPRQWLFVAVWLAGWAVGLGLVPHV